MEVIRHGRICQQSKRGLLQPLPQAAFERRVFGIRFEQRDAPNGSVYRVIEGAGCCASRFAWHRRNDFDFLLSK
jgi:hypothetical protein